MSRLISLYVAVFVCEVVGLFLGFFIIGSQVNSFVNLDMFRVAGIYLFWSMLLILISTIFWHFVYLFVDKRDYCKKGQLNAI